jgi:hypothetical protein
MSWLIHRHSETGRELMKMRRQSERLERLLAAVTIGASPQRRQSDEREACEATF